MAAMPLTDADLIISSWSAASPYGLGAEAFANGIRAGRTALSDLDRAQWDGPFDHAGLVPGFDIGALLGSKGIRAMDRSTGLAVVTVGLLLEGSGLGRDGTRADVGLVLGTGCGSARSIMDFTRDTLTQEKPFFVDPARFPNTVLNRAAGQSAIWYGLKGPNTTIAGGALTGLLALNYAVRVHRAGRCTTVLCGAVEEYSTQRGWIEWHSRDADVPQPPVGEGCAMFVLESAGSAYRRGRRPLAAVLGLRFLAFSRPGDARDVLARCVADVLKHSGADESQVGVVALSGGGAPLRDQEESAVAEVLGWADRTWVRPGELIGDTAAATGAFQLASAIAVGTGGARPAGELALVTSVDAAGTAGCALLRLVMPAGSDSREPFPVPRKELPDE